MSDIFANLTVENAELPAITRNRDSAPNPFLGPVGESYRDDQGKAVTVPGEHASAAVQKIRQAAEKLNIGVRIVCVLKNNGERLDAKALTEYKEKKSKAHVVVQFQGQDKRKYTGPKKKDGMETGNEPVAAAE